MKRINLDKDLNEMVTDNAEWAWKQTHGEEGAGGERTAPEKADSPVGTGIPIKPGASGKKGGAPDV